MNLVAQILAAVAVGILRYLLSRRDLMEKGQAVAYEEALRNAERALRWKADSTADPDHGATVGVRPDAPPITLPGQNPPPTSNSPDRPV